jgi:hypothetical protein
MDIETITALSGLVTGPGGALIVMGLILYGLYKTGREVLTPFLAEVSSGIRKGFDDQTTTLGTLVEEIKNDRDFHRENIRGLTGRIDKIETDVHSIKADVSDIKTIIEKPH